MAKQYQVRIPAEFADAFPEAKLDADGTWRARKRWKTPLAGKGWVRSLKDRISQLEAGADKAKVLRSELRPGTDIAIEDAVGGWLKAMNRRLRTKQSYEWTSTHLCRLVGGAPLSRFGLVEWDAYVTSRRREKNQKGKRTTDDALARERQVLQACAKWAASRSYAVHPQIFTIPRIKTAPRVVRRFDPESTDKAIRGLTPNSRARVIAELIAGTGMRSGEIRAARIEWVRWAERVIAIPHSEEYSPKGGRPRPLPLSKTLIATLKTWIGNRSTGLLFPPEARQRVGSGIGLWRVIADLRAAGVIRHGLHDLRVHYLSRMAQRGVRLRDLQELAGHVHSKTTDQYLKPAPDYMDSARRALEVDSDSDSDGE